ncbi:MAG: LysR family transcriptional regulator [Hyphomicrobiaceae bacterium]
MLDTDQLRSFLAIVDTGSFTRAAERVNKTQSAVSMQIRRLEERLGRSLFAKHGRGARLTDDGEKLIDYARRMLQIEASAMAAVAEQGLAGRVKLGIPDDYAEPFLPEILTRFMCKHPLVEVSVVCEHSLSLAEQVAAHELDLAVVTDCARISGVEVVREEPLWWVSGQTTGVSDDRPLAVALGAPTCAWRQTATAELEKLGIDMRLVLVSNNHAAIAPIVRAGLAVTVWPSSAMRPGFRVLGPETGLPSLPPCRIGLLQATGEKSREAVALADGIRSALSTPLSQADTRPDATGDARGRRRPMAAE